MTDRVPPLAPPDAPGPAGGVLVIGYGNSLRGDDGVGPRVAELAAADPRLAGAVVAAHHQLTPELALDMSAARLVVLVDATTDAAPGVVAVRRVDPAGGASGRAAGQARMAAPPRTTWGRASCWPSPATSTGRRRWRTS